MNKEKLYRQCGIRAAATKAREPKWVSARLRFLGAERYVLGTRTVELVLKHKDHGIALMFRHPLVVDASTLLGKHKISGLLVDVDVVIGDVTMRLASMNKEMYPIVLRDDEMVALI